MSKKNKNEIKDYPIWVACIVFAVFTYIFFSSQISGNTFFWEDFIEYVYPTQTFAARESAGFEIPFWNPYSFNGMPFFADLQVGFLYPINRILNLFVNTDGTLPVGAAQFVIILHFFIAQLSAFFLAKKFGISFFGSLITSTIYSFSMLLVCHLIHPMMLYHLAWFPMIFGLFKNSLETYSFRKSILAGGLFGMTMLSGHPQSTLYIAFFLGIYFIWQLVAGLKSKSISENKLIKNIAVGLIPFIISSGIFAVQLLPSQELAELSERKELSLERASEGSLEMNNFITMVLPDLFGKTNGITSNQTTFYKEFESADSPGVKRPYRHFYWETQFYFSVIGLMFGLLGAIYSVKDKRNIFLLVMAIFSMLYALGENSPLLSIFYNLPLFGNFRFPARIVFYLIIAMALFSGLAYDKLSKIKKIGVSEFLAIGIVLLLSLLGVSGAAFNIADTPEQIRSLISESFTKPIFMAILGGLTIFLLARKSFDKSLIGAILVLTIFADLYLTGYQFNQGNLNPKDRYTLPQSLEQSFKVNPPDDIFRVNMRMYDPSYMAMARNQGLVSEIMLVEGYNPLVLKRPVPRVGSKENVHDVLNVKYEIGIDRRNNQPRFYERFDRLPHAWTVKNYEIINPEDSENYYEHFDGDFSKTAILEDDPKIELSGDSINNDKVQILNYSNNEIELEVDCDDNSLLVLSEIFYPAWQAYVNDKHTKLYRANYALRSIPIEKGKNKVVLKYQSNTFYTGMWISIFTILFSIVGYFFAER